jgi:hypothetical protein
MKLFSIFKTPVIEFLCEERYLDVAPAPEPAMKNIPEWFKRISPYSKTSRDSHNRPNMNAKKCMPMLDAMSIGFTISLFIDQHIKTNHDCSVIEPGPTSVMFDKAVEFHSSEQVGGHCSPFGKTNPIKFINPWIVKTPPGWSTLFIPPINSFEDRFICLSGLVDTDRYPKEVNFPAKWLKPNFDDVLAAGTPLVTAIPVKRSDMNPEFLVGELTDADKQKLNKIKMNQLARSSYYTKELRAKR